MKRIVLLLGCCAVMSLGVQAGELYRWLDSKGKVHYGDEPAPVTGAVLVEPLKFKEGDSVTDLSYEMHRAQQNFPVTLYVAENCAELCDQARSLLNKRGIQFSEKMLRSNAELDAFRKLSGGESIPTLAVGKNLLQGFLAEQWNSELDIVGYPKIAPYRALKAPAAGEKSAAIQVAPLTLYVVDSCIEFCNRARTLLTMRGIPFNEKSLKTREEIEAFKQLSGSNLAPTLELGKGFLKGFQAEQWNSELDAAGYPKATPSAVASQVAPAETMTPANPVAP